MIGITAKIGEFFASLILALLTAGAKALIIGLLLLALTVSLMFTLRYTLARRNRDNER